MIINRRNSRNYRRSDVSRDRRENPGVMTTILDCDGNNLITGDIIQLVNNEYETGLFAYSAYNKCYGLLRGCWYGSKNPLDPRCYGKFIKIPNDNGMRMNIKRVNSYN